MILAALMMSVVGLDADYVLPPHPQDDTCVVVKHGEEDGDYTVSTGDGSTIDGAHRPIHANQRFEAVEFYWKDARAQWTIDCPRALR